MIANSAASITSSFALGGLGGSTTTTDTGDASFSTLVDQSSQDLATQTQAPQAQLRKVATDKPADAVSAPQATTGDQATNIAQTTAGGQTAADQTPAAQAVNAQAVTAQTATAQAASMVTGSTLAGLATTADVIDPSTLSVEAAKAALQKPKTHAAQEQSSAAATPPSAPTMAGATASSDSAVAAATTAAQTGDTQTADAADAPTMAPPSATDAFPTPTSSTLFMLTNPSATPSGGATFGVQAQASLAMGVAAPRVSPLSGLRVASPINVRVTATTSAGAGSTSASLAGAWQADLSAAASSAATVALDPATQASDAAPSSTMSSLMAGAADQAGSIARAAGTSANAAESLNIAAGVTAVTTESASVVGAAGSSSDPGSEDDDQQGAARTARDQANAAKAAQAGGDLPDAVLEATFGGLLAPPALSTVSSDDETSAATAVTSDTISDLASQTAAQASVGGVKSFQIVLNPEGLGQVTVAVSIAEDGKLNAAFTFEKPDAAAALSAHAGDLHAALAQSGFDASTSGLTFAAAPQTIATAAITNQTISLTFSQDYGQDSPAAGAVGSVSDWALAASQTAVMAVPSYGRLALARGLDVRA